MKEIRPPASNPCGSCPYRRDVPSGVWELEEYAKLPEYDRPTGEQPPAVFLCHRQDGRACAGWVAVHNMVECLGMRIATGLGAIADDDVEEFLSYETSTPVWNSGAEAAAHGVREVQGPSPKARRLIDKLTNQLGDKLIFDDEEE